MAKLVALDGYKANDAGIPEIHAEGCNDITRLVATPYGKFPREILMTGESLEEIAQTWYANDIAFSISEGYSKAEAIASSVSILRVMKCAKAVR